MAGLKGRLDALFGMDGFPAVRVSDEVLDEVRALAAGVFKMVEPRGHWKDPIDTEVPPDADLSDIAAAVEFFTGTTPTFTPVPKGWHVTAAGYRAGPAGDH